jgi:hypothetical protein
MPTDWAPTDAHRQQANDLGVDVNREAQRFRASSTRVSQEKETPVG